MCITSGLSALLPPTPPPPPPLPQLPLFARYPALACALAFLGVTLTETRPDAYPESLCSGADCAWRPPWYQPKERASFSPLLSHGPQYTLSAGAEAHITARFASTDVDTHDPSASQLMSYVGDGCSLVK